MGIQATQVCLLFLDTFEYLRVKIPGFNITTNLALKKFTTKFFHFCINNKTGTFLIC